MSMHVRQRVGIGKFFSPSLTVPQNPYQAYDRLRLQEERRIVTVSKKTITSAGTGLQSSARSLTKDKIRHTLQIRVSLFEMVDQTSLRERKEIEIIPCEVPRRAKGLLVHITYRGRNHNLDATPKVPQLARLWYSTINTTLVGQTNWLAYHDVRR
jgi:hypothetical protein